MSNAKPPPTVRRPPPAQPPINTSVARESNFRISSGKLTGAKRVGVYGSAGSGKTTLASLLTKVGRKPLLLDLEDGSQSVDVDRIECRDLQTWEALRSAIVTKSLWSNHDTVVIDSVTKAEDMAVDHLIRRAGVDSLEKVDGGWGKGYRALYECMLTLLGDLDGHIRESRSVVLIMHECTSRCPNPAGPDYLRFEPRLYQSEKISVRARVKEWLDTLAFISFDVIVSDGKARGGASRTIYVQEQPHFIAKSRTLRDPIVFDEGSAELWERLFSS